MSSPTQASYISDLAVLKTKEFKEVKEMLFATGIVKENSEIINSATTLAQITNALTDLQASKLIDALIAVKTPARSRQYATSRVGKAIAILDDIKEIIDGWRF